MAISYILNEPATAGVTIEIFVDTNVLRTIQLNPPEGTARGTNVVFWDGQDESAQTVSNGIYGVRITARSDGYTNWTQITDDNNAGNYVWEPRGIAINCNSNSPFYGRVFVANSMANPGSSSEPGDRVGILKLNADGSPADEGQFSTGGYPWAGDRFSPWKIAIADDDTVYINDWTSNGTVVAFDQLISTNYRVVLDSNNWAIVGTNFNTGEPNYANLNGPFVTGAGTNTQLWMCDISFNQDPEVAHSVGVRRFSLTNGVVAADDTGTTIVTVGFGSDLNLYPWDVCLDKNTNMYLVQYRANPADTAQKLMRFPQYDESSVPMSNAVWMVGGPDSLVGAYGVAVNPAGTFVAVALREGAAVQVFDTETGTNSVTVSYAPNHDRRDVAWDAVGNLYSVDNYDSTWRAFSPPGTNSATTVALQTFTIIARPMLSAPAVSDEQFTCILAGETNFNYVVESSCDLSQWTAISTNFLTNAIQPITIDAPKTRQFYRAVLAP